MVTAYSFTKEGTDNTRRVSLLEELSKHRCRDWVNKATIQVLELRTKIRFHLPA